MNWHKYTIDEWLDRLGAGIPLPLVTIGWYNTYTRFATVVEHR